MQSMIFIAMGPVPAAIARNCDGDGYPRVPRPARDQAPMREQHTSASSTFGRSAIAAFWFLTCRLVVNLCLVQ